MEHVDTNRHAVRIDVLLGFDQGRVGPGADQSEEAVGPGGKGDDLLAAVRRVHLAAEHTGGLELLDGARDRGLILDRRDSQVLLPQPVLLYEVGDQSYVGGLGAEALELQFAQ